MKLSIKKTFSVLLLAGAGMLAGCNGSPKNPIDINNEINHKEDIKIMNEVFEKKNNKKNEYIAPKKKPKLIRRYRIAQV